MAPRGLTDKSLMTAIGELCARAEQASVAGEQLRASLLLEGATALAERRKSDDDATVSSGELPIVVVEDNEYVRSGLEALLRARGHAVRVFSNGQQALDELTEDPAAALILLDLLMPEMDGWTFHERVSEDPRLATIPIIAMSESALPGPESVPLFPKALGLPQLVSMVSQAVQPLPAS
jgi:CheY-like chemotaxis protein